jgi:8-amino-7-oxononanoate synthase
LNFETELQKIKSKNLYRIPQTPMGIDLASNDYLGLRRNPEIINAFKEGIDRYGMGSGSSRLVSGHRDVIDQWENVFAEFVGMESSLWVANGFIANLGLLDTLSDLKTNIFTDRLNHGSILDGIRISGAKKKYYNHLDMDHLESLLHKSDSKQNIIITESVFSMDGDSPDLEKLIHLKKKYNAILILDEAHALGIFGNHGSGLSRDENYLHPKLSSEIDFKVFTMGKSLGLEGGLIATTKSAKEFLINKMRSFIFSTGPIPAIASAAIKSLEILGSMDQQRIQIKKMASKLRQSLVSKSIQTIPGNSQIIPILMNNEEEAISEMLRLRNLGFDIKAIRPPTVIQSRLRSSIHADLREEDLDHFIQSISLR